MFFAMFFTSTAHATCNITDAVSCHFAPAHRFSTAPRVLPAADAAFSPYRRSQAYAGATMAGIEHDEWMMVAALVGPTSVVLELGARYGTTSCYLAQATANSGAVVAVEPDPAAQDQLVANVRRNSCSVGVVRGTVGAAAPQVPSHIGRPGYASFTRPATAGERAVPNLGVFELEARLERQFDTVLLDCEGCIGAFFGEGGGGQALLAAGRLRLLLMEEDGDERHARYAARWYAVLRTYGFARVWQSHDTFNHSWSRTLVHSAWARGPLLAGTPTCEEFAARSGLARGQLTCMSLDDWPHPRKMRPCARQGLDPPGAQGRYYPRMACPVRGAGSHKDAADRSWVRGY